MFNDALSPKTGVAERQKLSFAERKWHHTNLFFFLFNGKKKKTELVHYRQQMVTGRNYLQ